MVDIFLAGVAELTFYPEPLWSLCDSCWGPPPALSHGTYWTPSLSFCRQEPAESTQWCSGLFSKRHNSIIKQNRNTLLLNKIRKSFLHLLILIMFRSYITTFIFVKHKMRCRQNAWASLHKCTLHLCIILQGFWWCTAKIWIIISHIFTQNTYTTVPNFGVSKIC